MTTIQGLIEALEEQMRLGVDGDTEVRLMSQPSWPFEYDIAGLYDASSNATNLAGFRVGPALYLVEGSQLGYGTTKAWDDMEPFGVGSR